MGKLGTRERKDCSGPHRKSFFGSSTKAWIHSMVLSSLTLYHWLSVPTQEINFQMKWHLKNKSILDYIFLSQWDVSWPSTHSKSHSSPTSFFFSNYVSLFGLIIQNKSWYWKVLKAYEPWCLKIERMLPAWEEKINQQVRLQGFLVALWDGLRSLYF